VDDRDVGAERIAFLQINKATGNRLRQQFIAVPQSTAQTTRRTRTAPSLATSTSATCAM